MNLALGKHKGRENKGRRLDQYDRCQRGEPTFFLCDFNLKAPARQGGWRKCNKPLCSDHATSRGGDTHHRPMHAKKAAA